jgi:hypothetical protein
MKKGNDYILILLIVSFIICQVNYSNGQNYSVSANIQSNFSDIKIKKIEKLEFQITIENISNDTVFIKVPVDINHEISIDEGIYFEVYKNDVEIDPYTLYKGYGPDIDFFGKKEKRRLIPGESFSFQTLSMFSVLFPLKEKDTYKIRVVFKFGKKLIKSDFTEIKFY